VDGGEKEQMKRLIYFAKSGGLIKIGETSNCGKRIKEIQMMSPGKVNLISSWFTLNAKDLERKLHARFAAHRRHGEWFAIPKDELAKVRAELDANYMAGPVLNGGKPFSRSLPTRDCVRKLAEQSLAEQSLADKLVNVDGLIEALFAPENKPAARTVWNWVREGQVPSIHIGRSVFFDPAAVRAAFEKRRQRQRKGRA
jgi:hypothetical protein